MATSFELMVSISIDLFPSRSLRAIVIFVIAPQKLVIWSDIALMMKLCEHRVLLHIHAVHGNDLLNTRSFVLAIECGSEQLCPPPSLAFERIELRKNLTDHGIENFSGKLLSTPNFIFDENFVQKTLF